MPKITCPPNCGCGRHHKNTEAAFWSQVDFLSSDCWRWTGNTNVHGYGRFSFRGKQRLAHRLSWELTHGSIPIGLSVLHKNECHNPLCVNPEHLYLGTQADNVRDAVELGNMRNPWNKGRKQSAEYVAKRVAGRSGYRHSEETRKKISESHRR